MSIVMAGVATIVFFVTHIIPADPVGAILGGNAPIELVDELRHKLGLDKPLLYQFMDYIKGIFTGNFGISLITQRPVIKDILQFFPATMELAFASVLFTIVFGIILGTLSAVKRNKPIDHVLRVFSIMGVSMPVFWLGLILLFVFYYHLGWLPGTGRHSLFIIPEHITGFVFIDSILTRDWDAFKDCFGHIILPAFVLGYASTASVARIMRASMLDVLRQDYIRTARSKGLGKRVVIYRHALRNALIPVITVIGISFGDLLSGAVLTETIFAWPGIGRYLVNGLLMLDYPAVTAGTLFVAFIYSLANLVVDVSYAVFDPRMDH
ncbi:MAG: ABC transporter permease [Desulfobacteraceae bacterium]|nr:ABC transporter permease [Desulfobacteraceae bacterium]